MKTGDYCHLASARIIATANMAAMPLRAFLLFSMTKTCRAVIAMYR